MQDYLEKIREKEELENEIIEEEIEKLENDVVDKFKDDANRLLEDIRGYLSERESEFGYDFGISAGYLLEHLIDKI